MSEIICHCFEVSREEIENAIREKGLKIRRRSRPKRRTQEPVVAVARNRYRRFWTKSMGNNLPSSNNKKIPDENSLSGIFLLLCR